MTTMGEPTTMEPCTHRPLTTRHLSISWCSPCQDWLLHWSQSGRRDESGGIVLIEHLKTESLGTDLDNPLAQAAWVQRLLLGVVELETDRIDTDALRPVWKLRSV